MTPENHAAQAGEPGHQGSDRQPGKDVGRSDRRTPGAGQAAGTGQTRARSKEAAPKPEVDRPDWVHPGPGRFEGEKSKGNLHHSQHEPQPDMQDQIEDL